MKKVRYAIAAIGMPPALGLMIPAANVSAAATHTLAKPAKKVALERLVVPDTGTSRLTCGASHHKSKTSHNHNHLFRVIIAYGGSDCINSVFGTLSSVHSPGLEMRTRIYSVPGGGKVFSNLIHGNWLGQNTNFSNVVNHLGLQACAALVDSHSPTKPPDYGAVCVSTT